MGYDVATAEQVREALSGYSGVAERPMIGGLAFLIGGHLVCEVMSELLLVPLDPSRPHPELPSGASGAAVGAVGRGIVRVPLRSLSSKKLLAWVKMGAERASQEAPRDLSKVKGITLARAHPRKAGKRKKDAVQPKPSVTVPQPAALTARGTGSTLVGVHDERRPQDAAAAAAARKPVPAPVIVEPAAVEPKSKPKAKPKSKVKAGSKADAKATAAPKSEGKAVDKTHKVKKSGKGGKADEAAAPKPKKGGKGGKKGGGGGTAAKPAKQPKPTKPEKPAKPAKQAKPAKPAKQAKPAKPAKKKSRLAKFFRPGNAGDGLAVQPATA